VILLLLFVALLIALVSRQPILAQAGITNVAVDLVLNVVSRVALVVFGTLLLLVVRSTVLGRRQDFR
jgi:hypothetical protein